jgi:hypothetical protein
MKNTAQLVNGLHALQFTEAHVEKIMQFLVSQEVKGIYANIREKENARKQKEANDSLIHSLRKQLAEANAKLGIFDIEAQIRNHPRNSTPWLGQGRDDYPLSDTVEATDGQRTFQLDRITGKAVSNTARHWGPTAPVDSYLKPEDCTEEEISDIVKAAKENLKQRGSIMPEKDMSNQPNSADIPPIPPIPPVRKYTVDTPLGKMHHVETVTPPTSASQSPSSDLIDPTPNFVEKSTIFGTIKVNTTGTSDESSSEPTPAPELNPNERTTAVLSIKVNAEGTPMVDLTPVVNLKTEAIGFDLQPSPSDSQKATDETVDSPKCACGNPVDMTNQDCVDYGLCKDHELDV